MKSKDAMIKKDWIHVKKGHNGAHIHSLTLTGARICYIVFNRMFHPSNGEYNLIIPKYGDISEDGNFHAKGSGYVKVAPVVMEMKIKEKEKTMVNDKNDFADIQSKDAEGRSRKNSFSMGRDLGSHSDYLIDLSDSDDGDYDDNDGDTVGESFSGNGFERFENFQNDFGNIENKFGEDSLSSGRKYPSLSSAISTSTSSSTSNAMLPTSRMISSVPNQAKNSDYIRKMRLSRFDPATLGKIAVFVGMGLSDEEARRLVEAGAGDEIEPGSSRAEGSSGVKEGRRDNAGSSDRGRDKDKDRERDSNRDGRASLTGSGVSDRLTSAANMTEKRAKENRTKVTLEIYGGFSICICC